ncbi:hypothetical protein PINS_up009316 [Pythium insidiosum]|nr:hypothetical protein PINS_up009316 [Pythium insidiosum]
MEASTAVLGDASLFREITAFQSGIPFRFASYLQRHRALLHGDTRVRGLLPRLALLRDDVDTLASLWTLTQATTYYRELPVLSFSQIASDVAVHGRPACVAWLHDSLSSIICREGFLAEPAIAGNADAVEWLAAHCARCASSVDSDTIHSVATRGFTAVLRPLYALHPQLFTSTLVVETARLGHVAALQFLHEHVRLHSPSDCQTAMNAAAAAGHLAAVALLHAKCSAGCTSLAMDDAAANGHLDVVEFLHSHRREGCTTFAMDRAAANGHLSVVEFLHRARTEGCTTYAMDRAASHGHLDVLSFLHCHRRERCSPWALADAAENGHLAVVQFLHTNALCKDWDDSALYRAARRGHLDVVTYLCEETVVTDRIFDARRGAESFAHHDVVRFLNQRILRLLEQRDLEQRERLRRRKHAKAKKKRK